MVRLVVTLSVIYILTIFIICTHLMVDANIVQLETFYLCFNVNYFC